MHRDHDNGQPCCGYLLAVILAWLAGCGDQPAAVVLQPLFGTQRQCARTSEARLLLVTSHNANNDVTVAVSLDDPTAVDLRTMPTTTTQLSAQLVGPAGEVVAVGNSMPLPWADLQSGTSVAVYMAPEQGGCDIAPMNMARLSPLVAAAGAGALVLSGGTLAGDVADLSAEYFDPDANVFVAVELPTVFATAATLQGSAVLSRSDGTAIVFAAGTGAYAVFDPVARSFNKPRVFDNRWQFSVAEFPDGRVAVAGGCRTASNGRCVSDPTLRVVAIDLAADDITTIGNLAEPQLGAQLLWQASGGGRGDSLLLVGGSNLAGFAASVAQRINIANGAVSTVSAAGQAVTLDSGAILTGYASAQLAGSSQVNVIPPGSAQSRPFAGDAPRSGPTLVAQQDGEVLVIGGGADVSQFLPSTGATSKIVARGDAMPAVKSSAAVRLGDGSVLVVGGDSNGSPLASAWRYRPSLLGPASATVLLSAAMSTAGFTATDPSELTLSGNEFILAPAGATTRALAVIGGPRRMTATLTADLRVSSGGIALLFDYLGPDQWLGVELVPGSKAQLLQRQISGDGVICSGAMVALLSEDATLVMKVTESSVEVRRGGQPVLQCALSNVKRRRGLWGLGAVGAGTTLRVAQVVLAP
jgi:hypothetical protein